MLYICSKSFTNLHLLFYQYSPFHATRMERKKREISEHDELETLIFRWNMWDKFNQIQETFGIEK